MHAHIHTHTNIYTSVEAAHAAKDSEIRPPVPQQETSEKEVVSTSIAFRAVVTMEKIRGCYRVGLGGTTQEPARVQTSF